MQTKLYDFVTKSTGDYSPKLFDIESGSSGIEHLVSQEELLVEFSSFLYNALKSSFSSNGNEEQSTAGILPSRYNLHNIAPNNSTATSDEIKNNNDLVMKERLVSIIQSCYFEAGTWTEADEFFATLKQSRGAIANSLELLSDIVNHNLANDHVLEGILHILSNYNYEDINPYGITISLACALNHSPVIQDLLISCFEKWNSADAINILESLVLEDSWLVEYRDEVVAQLKSNEMSA